jgi:hypothetical protein
LGKSVSGGGLLLRGTRAGLIDSILASADLINIFLLETVNTGAAIKLLSKHLVGLAEAIKFGSKVDVLSLEASGMLIESLLFGKVISVNLSELLVHQSLGLNISAAHEKSFFFLLETDLSVTDLNCKVGVTAFLKLDFLAEIEVFGSNTLVVATKSTILRSNLSAGVLCACELTVGILKLNLLAAEIGRARIDFTLSVLDARVHTLDL